MKSDFRHRFELAYNLISIKTKSLLDYGCSDGSFLFAIRSKLPKAKLYGFEIDKRKINPKLFQKNKIKIISSLIQGKLPIRLSSLDSVVLLEVLEHVPDEKNVIDEIYRVLKPGGVLLLSTPNKGLTEVFDAGNLKFRFPKFHKFLYQKVFRQKNYESLYQTNKYLSGDVSIQKHMWHRHYNISDIQKLLGNKFRIEKVNYYGLFYPVLAMIYQALLWKFKFRSKLFSRLMLKDSRTNFGPFSYSIFLKAIRV